MDKAKQTNKQTNRKVTTTEQIEALQGLEEKQGIKAFTRTAPLQTQVAGCATIHEEIEKKKGGGNRAVECNTCKQRAAQTMEG